MLHASAVAPTPTVLSLPAIRVVAALSDADRRSGNVHDHVSREVLLTRIAALLDIGIGDVIEDATLHVPGDAIDRAAAKRRNIRRRDQILGGVVPAAFVATKAITHGLLHADAQAPCAWASAMVELMGDAALNGYTAFNREDAFAAGQRLLADGPVRIKDVCAKAGLGQIVVHHEAALADALSRETDADLARDGIVLEENLTDVVTYSVGSIELGGRTISYWGSQNLTTDHQGRNVYGGSDLYVVRGGLDLLAAEPLPPAIARAVACAATFDRSAHLAYPDLLLTRRNYDVIEGTDATGERRIGVLEQSWRVGGASGAEVAAFEALRDEPDTHAVRCSTVEVYADIDPPTGATQYFRGVDPKVGAMTKYAVRLA